MTKLTVIDNYVYNEIPKTLNSSLAYRPVDVLYSTTLACNYQDAQCISSHLTEACPNIIANSPPGSILLIEDVIDCYNV